MQELFEVKRERGGGGVCVTFSNSVSTTLVPDTSGYLDENRLMSFKAALTLLNVSAQLTTIAKK